MTNPSLAACAATFQQASAVMIENVGTMRVTGAAAAVTGKGVRAGGGLVRLCASLVVESAPSAEGVGGAVHAACGAEGVGVTASTASGTAFLKKQARSTAAKRITRQLDAQAQRTAAG